MDKRKHTLKCFLAFGKAFVATGQLPFATGMYRALVCILVGILRKNLGRGQSGSPAACFAISNPIEHSDGAARPAKNSQYELEARHRLYAHPAGPRAGTAAEPTAAIVNGSEYLLRAGAPLKGGWIL